METSKDAIHMFNSLSFRPSGKTNLYAWLFGTKQGGDMQGRLCQGISEYLDKYTTDRPYTSDQKDQEDYEDKIRQAQIDNQEKYSEEEKSRHDDGNNDPDYDEDDPSESYINESGWSKRVDEYKQALIVLLYKVSLKSLFCNFH
ncbi:hypothetical protein FBQ80_17230 [Candidatus Brocadia sp. AMX2]|uniref:Uncharacterized protein n=1 Tax=Candidatus Brocadia sinica JPN1 TaxID=1197129 RepID=A0ABQ0JSS5_9BACT|nr:MULTISPECIES: hypothetical protein [Brocadia]NOG43365.1 hypothetical protein [Planctomycetota bacterium]RIJ88741.1 MAG: hypothetical protein DB853_17050 [Candidatus Brocadia sp.]GIK12603.1 MAG: hypothetical protein BroJett002_13100 [Candidatus Brocadia sinica]KAA0241520.1 MAG: hypothetical protein EDM70_17795 [Candidatus Brocadia sp. AMX2]MDL1937271.1 hypothetical protein [Candidatus Brocadia sp. AMX2]